MALTLTVATVSTTGSQLTLTFNESVSAADGGVTLSASGGAVTVSLVGVAGNSVFYSTSREILGSESVLMSYSGTSIQDLSGNALSHITDRSVTNLSEAQGPSPVWTISFHGSEKTSAELTVTSCEGSLTVTVTTAPLTVTVASNE